MSEVNLKCICCGKKLERCLDAGDVEVEPEVDAWDYAGVHLFVPGFGSRHDMSDIVVGICDDCIDKRLEDGSIYVKASLEDKLNAKRDEMAELATHLLGNKVGYCEECKMPAKFVLHTQFAGDHYYCAEHAKTQKNVGELVLVADRISPPLE